MTEKEKNILADYYCRLERQGPGSPSATLEALSFIEDLGADSKIADIGCGTGGQTLILAQNTTSHIIGIDLFPQFIEALIQQAANCGLTERLSGRVESMDLLNFEKEELDLIWSEGAIYNIGFKKGLQEWKPFLKKGGHIAVSEISWLSNERPKELNDFWTNAYPEIKTIKQKKKDMEKSGYELITAFILPEESWTRHYYIPQKKIYNDFLNQHKGNAFAQGIVDEQIKEARLYEKYKDYYSYVFYIGKKK